MWETKVVGKALNRPQITQVWNIFQCRLECKQGITFNSLKTSQPSDVRELFTFCCETSSINTRSSLTDLKIPVIKTEIAKSKISFSGASLFNSLPDDLKVLQITQLFHTKKHLKCSTFSNALEKSRYMEST
jgi:hypothetical protein